jgi:hypothetical protein
MLDQPFNPFQRVFAINLGFEDSVGELMDYAPSHP